MEIQLLNNDSLLWKKIVSFARECSWRAGKALADKMEKNDFKNWEIVFLSR